MYRVQTVEYKYGQKIHHDTNYYCTPRLQPEGPTRFSHLSYPYASVSDTRNEPNDGEKRKKKKEKGPQNKKKVEKQRAKGGNNKGEREQRLPLH